MAIFMMGNGLMTKQTVMEFTNIRMEQSIRENGKMISSMALEYKNGLMVKNMRDNIKMELKQGKEFLSF